MRACPVRPTLVTIVVPAREAERTLAEQLDAIAGQDYAGPYELVIALNGGRDGTRAVAQAWVDEHGTGRVVDASARRGPAFARNVGAESGSGDFLAFCDADDVVSPGWLTALVAAAADADLVTGPVQADRLNDTFTRGANDIPEPGRPFHGFLPMAGGSK